jgi:hypothetical protein
MLKAIKTETINIDETTSINVSILEDGTRVVDSESLERFLQKFCIENNDEDS